MYPFAEIVARDLSRYKTPGASLALSDGGGGGVSEGYGYRDFERGLPATPDTIYSIASITKVFTSVAVMRLVEDGRLSLDDPAERFLGVELRVKGKPVTVEHLLSHTSGIPAIAYAEALVSSSIHGGTLRPYTRRDALNLLTRAAKDWAVAEPGEEYYYLNEGYVALGYIIERVTGKAYEEFIREAIADTLGIRDIYFNPWAAEGTGRLAYPYTSAGGGLRRVNPFPYAWSDGGIYTSALEVSKLMASLAGIGGVEVLSRRTVREMLKPRARMTSQLFGDDYYGLGLIVYNGFPLGPLAGHSGGLPGYRSYAGFILNRQQVIALLTNGEVNATNLAMKVLMAYNGEDPGRLPFTVKERILSSAEGLYVGFEGNIKACLSRLDDFLLLESKEPGGTLKAVLVPNEDDIRAGGTVIRLASYRDGRVIQGKLILEGNPVLIYERYKMVKSGATC